MKKLFLSILVLGSGLLHAQKFSYPKFPSTAKSLTEFVPPNWFLKDSAAGDLNGDKLADLAFVIEYKDTVQEKRPDGALNTGSPRILGVLLTNAKTRRYDLFLQNNTFIVRYGEGGMDPEPYGDVIISTGILELNIYFLRGRINYKYRMQKGDLFLIGGSSGGVSGGIFYGFDANFSTGKGRIEEGPIDQDKAEVKWIRIPKTKLKKLRDMRMILQWEVVQGQYL